jgi:hypothetical protein
MQNSQAQAISTRRSAKLIEHSQVLTFNKYYAFLIAVDNGIARQCANPLKHVRIF